MSNKMMFFFWVIKKNTPHQKKKKKKIFFCFDVIIIELMNITTELPKDSAFWLDERKSNLFDCFFFHSFFFFRFHFSFRFLFFFCFIVVDKKVQLYSTKYHIDKKIFFSLSSLPEEKSRGRGGRVKKNQKKYSVIVVDHFLQPKWPISVQFWKTTVCV